MEWLHAQTLYQPGLESEVLCTDSMALTSTQRTSARVENKGRVVPGTPLKH